MVYKSVYSRPGVSLSPTFRATAPNGADEAVKKIFVQKDSYYDSVFLMLMSREVKSASGVRDATVAMGTEMNLDLLRSQGFDANSLAGATPNDLVIAVDCASAEAADAAMAAAKLALGRKPRPAGSGGAGSSPTSLSAALAALPGANLAVVSLPGAYAAREARKALESGLHVMLFSDNVSLEDEIALKALSRRKGLLLMGPDCGTAIVNGKPLCFANVVKRGPVGVVGASGTGMQEVACLVDRAGSGVSQAIGAGGRDLKNERVGGSTTLIGIEALARDDETKVIVVISKPPAKAVAERVLSALERSGKPAVVYFVGLAPEPRRAGSGVQFAANLEETAGMAVALAEGGSYAPQTFTLPAAAIEAIVDRETRAIGGAQKYLRGFYTGGTLADEAWMLVHQCTGAAYSNNQTDPRFVLGDPHRSVGHTIVDLGDDVFTLGRPHPMIDPSARIERMAAERDDAEIAVVLVDVVLGYGSHDDPAGALAPAVQSMREAARKRGGYLPVLASITGTEGDPQNLALQTAKLEAAGCVVMPSNHQASLLATKLLERLNDRSGKAGAAWTRR
jgi:succinyl-CoA synthetase alpha subunit